MEKLAIFKKVKDGKEYYAVYKIDDSRFKGEEGRYKLIGFLSSYQVDCAIHMEVK